MNLYKVTFQNLNDWVNFDYNCVAVDLEDAIKIAKKEEEENLSRLRLTKAELVIEAAIVVLEEDWN